MFSKSAEIGIAAERIPAGRARALFSYNNEKASVTRTYIHGAEPSFTCTQLLSYSGIS
jgi:hypothetical protein